MMTDIGAMIHSKTQSFFYATGFIIARRPKLFIILIVVSTLLLSIGLINFREENNVREDFSSINAPSRYEFAVMQEFFKNFGSPFHLVIVFEAADKGSLLRPRYLDEAINFEGYLRARLNISYNQRTYSYMNLCKNSCESAEAVSIFLNLYREIEIRKSIKLKLTYPTMDVSGHRIYLANSIFKVDFNERSNVIKSAGIIAINFHAIISNDIHAAVVSKWEQAVLKFASSTKGSDLIRVYAASETIISNEIRKTGVKVSPLIAISLVVIILFSALTSLRPGSVTSKPMEAAFGVLCPIISMIASFGALFWLGYTFLPIVCIVPFLILAIGVDDSFIFLHCYSRTNGKLCVEERIAAMLAEAGPSITITSLTNFLSFLISSFTPTPAIQVFSIFISAGVLFDYIYQIFLYTAILTISGRNEEANVWTPYSNALANKKMYCDSNEFNKFLDSFIDLWVDFTTSTTARVTISIVIVVYWMISIYGLMQIKVGLSSEKLFMDDSEILPFVRIQSDILFKEGGQVVVYINNPGNLSSSHSIPEIMQMLIKFETATGSVGPISTNMWLHQYMPYIGTRSNGSINYQYKYLPDFLSTLEYQQWSHFISLKSEKDCLQEKPSCVHRFFFTTGFKNAVAWSDRLNLLTKWRGIASQYQNLNVSIFEPFSMYADQLLTIVPATESSVTVAFLCTTAVLAILTPSITAVITCALSVLSINIGVIGSLAYWNVDLDPISMATILMSVGFSVDFIAHIAFHYCKEKTGSKKKRLKHALESVVWPMMQAGFSTILCLCVLAIIPAYMMKVFVKVVILVVLLGLFHGLLVLPVLFGILPISECTPMQTISCPQKVHVIRVDEHVIMEIVPRTIAT